MYMRFGVRVSVCAIAREERDVEILNGVGSKCERGC